MTTWIVLAVIVVVAVYGVVLFNRLVRARQMAEEGWSGIDVQLKRRADLVPNLVSTVQGYATHERQVLEEATRLRAAAGEARQGVQGSGRAAIAGQQLEKGDRSDFRCPDQPQPAKALFDSK